MLQVIFIFIFSQLYCLSKSLQVHWCFCFCGHVAMPMKRPASSHAQGSVKRPAASKETINSSLVALRKGRDEDEHLKAQEDADLEGDEVRDKAKAEKFSRMRAAGQLPAYLINMYEEESKVSDKGSRKFKTAIINRMFTKSKDGTWQLDVSDAIFTDYKSIFEKKYSKDKVEALPKSLVIGQFFHGDEKKFHQALNDGELELVREEAGLKFYGWKKFVVGTTRGSEQKITTEGKKKLTLEEHHDLGDVFARLKWTWKGSKPGDKKELEVGNIPSTMLDLMKKAHSACDKLAKDALKLQSLCPVEKRDGLKHGYSKMSQCLSTLDHLRNFCELPDGTKLTGVIFDKTISDVATQVDSFNRMVEECKGAVKARKN